MKRISGIVLAALLAGAPAVAQDLAALSQLGKVLNGHQASRSLNAVSTDVIGIFFYTGTALASGTVTVASNNTVTLKSGAVAAEAADTSIECPLSGAYAGVLDLTNAACNTAGELANVVNGTSGSNWRFIPLDALLTDDLNGNINNLSETRVTGNGLNVLWLSTALDQFTVALLPSSDANPMRDIRGYYPRSSTGRVPVTKPFGTWRTAFYGADIILTYAAGAPLAELWTRCNFTISSAGLISATETRVLSTAVAATTALKEWRPFPLGVGYHSDPGCELIVRVDQSTTDNLTVPTVSVAGVRY